MGFPGLKFIMNEKVTLDGYFDEAREYIEANAKNEIQTERLNEMIFGLHEEWKHRAKTMDSNKNQMQLCILMGKQFMCETKL